MKSFWTLLLALFWTASALAGGITFGGGGTGGSGGGSSINVGTNGLVLTPGTNVTDAGNTTNTIQFIDMGGGTNQINTLNLGSGNFVTNGYLVTTSGSLTVNGGTSATIVNGGSLNLVNTGGGGGSVVTGAFNSVSTYLDVVELTTNSTLENITGLSQTLTVAAGANIRVTFSGTVQQSSSGAQTDFSVALTLDNVVFATIRDGFNGSVPVLEAERPITLVGSIRGVSAGAHTIRVQASNNTGDAGASVSFCPQNDSTTRCTLLSEQN